MALSAENRLRRSADFKNVLVKARKAGRAGDRLLLVSGIPTANSGSRVGLSVSKRVGGSVMRSRVKRRLREVFRELVVSPGETAREKETGWDFVVSARPDAAEASYQELRGSAQTLVARVKSRRGPKSG